VKCLEINRINGLYPLRDARDVFNRWGIVILKGYLPPDTQEAIRAILERKLEMSGNEGKVLRVKEYPQAQFLLGDVLAVRELDPYQSIFFAPECIRMVKSLLATEELLYWGDSSIQFGEAARGFHKDNVDRLDHTQDDWSRNYELARCGFYLQDHTRHSGGLKVRLGSHGFPSHLRGKMADVSTRYGDMVIWNMRLTHSGNNKKLRFLRLLSLHPRLEDMLPSFFAAPEQTRRIAAFCSFGKPGSHVDRYIERMNSREKDFKPYFQHARNRDDASALVAKHGASFRLPNDFYGELD
jgi:hypothetical protein